MSLKIRQAVEAAVELYEEPLAAVGTAKLFDAMADFWPVKRLYGRMIDGLPPEQQEHLRALTRAPIDEAALLALPEGTFGHRYAAYQKKNRYDIDGRHLGYPPVNEAFARNWVMHRFAKIHDMLHVLLQFDAQPPSEVALQLFHTVNFGEPFGAAAVATLPLILFRFGRAGETFQAIRKALRVGRGAENLLQTPLEDLFDQDLGEVRRRLGIVLDAR